MLKPWHVKALWFKVALEDVLLEGQTSLTVVQVVVLLLLCCCCSDGCAVAADVQHVLPDLNNQPKSRIHNMRARLCCRPALCNACCMYVSRNDASIDQGDVAAKVRRDEERRSLAEGSSTPLPRDQSETSRVGVFVAPFLVARKDCAQFIKWKGDAGGLNHIRGEKVRARGQRLRVLLAPASCPHSSQVPKFSMEEEKLAEQSADAALPLASSAVSARVVQLMTGLGLRATTHGDDMGDHDL